MIGRRLLLMAMALVLTSCPSGWRLVRAEGAPVTVPPEMWDLVHCTASRINGEESSLDPHGCGERRKPLVHCADPKFAELCRSEPIADSTDRRHHKCRTAECSELHSLLSFIHFSDAQLKDHNVAIEGPLGTEAYDALTGTTTRHPWLERNDDAVLLATVLAANQLKTGDLKSAFAPYPPPSPPRFAIHTGDAMDAGMFSELFQFLAIADEFEIPFFNALGNHDNLFFGTFPPEHMKGLNVVIPYVPVVDTDRFMHLHCAEGGNWDLALPSPSQRTDHMPTVRGKSLWPDALGTPRTFYHGFDLACPDRPRSGVLCPEARGYYAFDLPLPPEKHRKFRIIVLNTAEVVPTTVGEGNDRRSKGNMLPEQLRWLERELSATTPGIDTRFLVFGHHNFDLFLHDDQRDAFMRLLLEEPRVLGYLTGHTHVDAIRAHPRADGSTFWEIVAGSTLVFPQYMRIVEVLEDDVDGRLFLRVASFRQQLGDAPERIASAFTASAETLPDDNCTLLAQDTSYCYRLARRSRLGRLGADADHNDGDRRPEAQAIPQANGLLLAYDPRRKPARRR